MLIRNINKIIRLCVNPDKCLRAMLGMSLIAHLAFLVDMPRCSNLSGQIILDSQKSDITLINYSQIQLKWEELKPVVKMKSDAGEIPNLFRKKKRKKIQRKKIVSVSLSSEALNAKDTYETRILKRIHRMKYYPHFAKRMGNEGIVGVKFILSKDGCLKKPAQIIKKTGHNILNNAGLTTIRNANPFPAFPHELSKEREDMTFIVSVEYSLNVQ